MRVLYDISILADSLGNERSRTGVYRVIANLAIGLDTFSQIKIQFICKNKYYYLARKYLSEHNFFHRKLISGKYNSFFKKMDTIKDRILNQLTGLCKHKSVEGFFWKVFRRIFIYIVNTVLFFPHMWLESFLMINSKNFDIYHSPYYNLQWHRIKKIDIPIIQTVYDLLPITQPSFFMGKSNNQDIIHSINLLHPKDGIICISKSTKSDLERLYPDIDSSQIYVVPLAASVNFYPCMSNELVAFVKRKYGIPVSAKYVLSLSTIEPRKNLLTLIRSFLNFAKSMKDDQIFLVLAGTSGWKNNAIYQEIQNNEFLHQRVITTGYIEDADLSPLYSGATVFVYPSFYEGFGLPPLEAMQCGVPVITSNTSSLPEVVGDAGIMLDPNDVEGFQDSMYKVFTDIKLRQEMSVRSIAQAKLFSWEKCINMTIQVYQHVLDKYNSKKGTAIPIIQQRTNFEN